MAILAAYQLEHGTVAIHDTEYQGKNEEEWEKLRQIARNVAGNILQQIQTDLDRKEN